MSSSKGAYISGLSEERRELAREIAEVLGFTTARGPAGGSLGALIDAVVEKYEEEPDQVLHFLGLLLKRPWSPPQKYRLIQPEEPPAPARWVWGRTMDGREGWMPQMQDGRILDEIDEDLDIA